MWGGYFCIARMDWTSWEGASASLLRHLAWSVAHWSTHRLVISLAWGTHIFRVAVFSEYFIKYACRLGSSPRIVVHEDLEIQSAVIDCFFDLGQLLHVVCFLHVPVVQLVEQDSVDALHQEQVDLCCVPWVFIPICFTCVSSEAPFNVDLFVPSLFHLHLTARDTQPLLYIRQWCVSHWETP